MRQSARLASNSHRNTCSGRKGNILPLGCPGTFKSDPQNWNRQMDRMIRLCDVLGAGSVDSETLPKVLCCNSRRVVDIDK